MVMFGAADLRTVTSSIYTNNSHFRRMMLVMAEDLLYYESHVIAKDRCEEQ